MGLFIKQNNQLVSVGETSVIEKPIVKYSKLILGGASARSSRTIPVLGGADSRYLIAKLSYTNSTRMWVSLEEQNLSSDWTIKLSFYNNGGAYLNTMYMYITNDSNNKKLEIYSDQAKFYCPNDGGIFICQGLVTFNENLNISSKGTVSSTTSATYGTLIYGHDTPAVGITPVPIEAKYFLAIRYTDQFANHTNLNTLSLVQQLT